MAAAGRRSRRGSPIGREVEPQDRHGDDLDIEVGEGNAGGRGDTVKAVADDMQRVLGGAEQDTSGRGHDEAAQAGRAGGDRDGKIERQERLAALGLAADDADGLLRPQAGDQPAVLLAALGKTISRLDRQQAHRRGLAVFGSGSGGVAHISRNSFSSMWRASR